MAKFLGVLSAAALCVSTLGAQAQESIKVGMILTLSGPPAAIGQQIRQGFELALEQMDGKLGGRTVELIVEDDELKPDIAVGKARALTGRDDVDIVVGPVFSNILQAIIKPVTDSDTILISTNPGTSQFAGAACNENLFVTSLENEQFPSALGIYSNRNGLDRVTTIVPNYQAGRDQVAGFKTTFEGEVVEEIYVPLNQLDFSAELTRIAVSGVPAIYAFLPGGMGINFVKQFNQAGLKDRVTVLSTFTADEVTLPAQGEAAVGIIGATQWAPDLDTAQNIAFVEAYEKSFGAVPANFAAIAFDTAKLLDSALKSLGDAELTTETLRDAIKNAKFDSVRGSFKFNTNHFPIQDIILTEIGQREDGVFQTQYLETVLLQNEDKYATDCKM